MLVSVTSFRPSASPRLLNRGLRNIREVFEHLGDDRYKYEIMGVVRLI